MSAFAQTADIRGRAAQVRFGARSGLVRPRATGCREIPLPKCLDDRFGLLFVRKTLLLSKPVTPDFSVRTLAPMSGVEAGRHRFRSKALWSERTREAWGARLGHRPRVLPEYLSS